MTFEAINLLQAIQKNVVSHSHGQFAGGETIRFGSIQFHARIDSIRLTTGNLQYLLSEL